MENERIGRLREANGTRVKLRREVEHFSLGIYPVGTSGTLVRHLGQIDDFYWVKLDEDHPELAEWNNELQLDTWVYPIDETLEVEC